MRMCSWRTAKQLGDGEAGRVRNFPILQARQFVRAPCDGSHSSDRKDRGLLAFPDVKATGARYRLAGIIFEAIIEALCCGAQLGKRGDGPQERPRNEGRRRKNRRSPVLLHHPDDVPAAAASLQPPDKLRRKFVLPRACHLRQPSKVARILKVSLLRDGLHPQRLRQRGARRSSHRCRVREDP